MHGDVPFPTEFEPVARIPPVAVEMPIGEAGDFCKGAQDIFKDDQENKQERNHEREQKQGNTL